MHKLSMISTILRLQCSFESTDPFVLCQKKNDTVCLKEKQLLVFVSSNKLTFMLNLGSIMIAFYNCSRHQCLGSFRPQHFGCSRHKRLRSPHHCHHSAIFGTASSPKAPARPQHLQFGSFWATSFGTTGSPHLRMLRSYQG